jgi:hypothetical protein
MSATKAALAIVMLGSGFGASYLWRAFNTPAPVLAVANPPMAPTVVGDRDESLILPPPDTRGVMIEPARDMIKHHLRGSAGLGNFSILDPALQPVEHRVETPPVETERPRARFRLNLEFDVDLPSPRVSLLSRIPPTIFAESVEVAPMPREVWPRVFEGLEAEQLPMPREASVHEPITRWGNQPFLDCLASWRWSASAPREWERHGVSWAAWIKSLADIRPAPEPSGWHDGTYRSPRLDALMEAIGPPRPNHDHWFGIGRYL